MTPTDDIEPELREPTPRIVRGRWNVHFVRWLFLVLGIIVPGVMVGFGLHLQQQWEALRDHGREVVGHVVRRDPRVTGKDGHPPRFKIEYVVDGATHAVFENVTDEEFDRTPDRAPFTLRYLPEAPEAAAGAAALVDRPWSGGALALGIVGALIAVIVIPFLIYIERSRGRMRALLRDGTPTRTTALEYVRHVKLKNAEYWHLRYAYAVDGGTREVAAKVDAAIERKLREGGDRATVLYDPLDPSRSELYLHATHYFRIESSVLRSPGG